MHKARGWQGIGYHLVIRRDGRVEMGEDLRRMGAHCKGVNDRSVGVCMVGGVDEENDSAHNLEPEQFRSLASVLNLLMLMYPKASVRGHRDFSPDKNRDGVVTPDEFMKLCPCFEVDEWLSLEDPADGVYLAITGDTLAEEHAFETVEDPLEGLVPEPEDEPENLVEIPEGFGDDDPS
jgi:N-acetyl-anhydromuramyl-L-alanine amidase AmpD